MSLRKEREDIYISEDDYLHEEHHVTEFRNEYIDGYVYAMVGESANHNHLTNNILFDFHEHLENSSCCVFCSGFKVKTGTNYFYPDVFVACDNEDEYYTKQPTIIVEILSPLTFKYDRLFKVDVYKKIPSLIECVIVEQDKCFIEVHQRESGVWDCAAYSTGDDIHFKSIDLTLSVDAIYTNVDGLEL